MAWGVEKIHQNSGPIFDALTQCIRNARESIDFETFIFERDALGERILAELVQAAAAGKRVRLLVDGVGSPQFDPKFIEELQAKRIRVRVYQPWKNFFRRIFLLFISGRWMALLPEMALMNRRDHRKTCVVDGEIAWVGSANVSLRHTDWRETVVEVRGEDVSLIQESFEWIWARCRSGKPATPHSRFPDSNESVHNSFGFETRRKKERFRRTIIRGAKSRVRLVNPYFVPPFPFLIALLRARRRGVQVEIMVPVKSDFRIVQWVSRTYYSILLRAGAEIYEYERGMLHAKILIADDRAVMGSSNYDFRSFLHDMEIDVLLSFPETLATLDAQWEVDRADCRSVRASALPRVGRLRGMALGVVSYFKKHL